MGKNGKGGGRLLIDFFFLMIFFYFLSKVRNKVIGCLKMKKEVLKVSAERTGGLIIV